MKTADRRYLATVPVILLCACLFHHCGDEGASLPVTTGPLEILLGASLSEFDSVSVTISQVSGVVNGSTVGMLSAPVTVRLSDLAALDLARVVREDMPIGEYTQLVVAFGGVDLVKDGARVTVSLSSSAQTGARSAHRFTVRTDTLRELVLDVNLLRSLDLRRIALQDRDSLTAVFMPVIRFVDRSSSGHVSGRILNPEHRAHVYLVADRDTVTIARATPADGAFFHAWLPEQRYTLLARDTLGRSARLDSVVVQRDRTTDVGSLTLE